MALRDISLAELTGGIVHIAHMSARQTLDAVRYGKARGIKVTCEVTPHHFVLTDERLGAPVAYDTNTKMNPPLREEADRDAMLAGDCGRQRRRHRHRSCAAPRGREARRVRPGAVRDHRPRDRGLAVLRPSRPRGRDLAAAPRRAPVGEPGAHSSRPRRHARRRRAGRHHASSRRTLPSPFRRRACGRSQEHAVRWLAAPRRRRRNDRRWAGRVRQWGHRAQTKELRKT